MVFYQKEVSDRIFVMIAGIIGIGAFLLFFEGFYLRWYFILYGIIHIVYEYYSIHLIKKTPVIVSYDEFLTVSTPRLTYEIKWENIIKVTSKEGIEGGAYMTIFFKNEEGNDEKVILNFNYLELNPAYVVYSIQYELRKRRTQINLPTREITYTHTGNRNKQILLGSLCALLALLITGFWSIGFSLIATVLFSIFIYDRSLPKNPYLIFDDQGFFLYSMFIPYNDFMKAYVEVTNRYSQNETQELVIIHGDELNVKKIAYTENLKEIIPEIYDKKMEWELAQKDESI